MGIHPEHGGGRRYLESARKPILSAIGERGELSYSQYGYCDRFHAMVSFRPLLPQSRHDGSDELDDPQGTGS